MTQTVMLNGDSQTLLKMLLEIISDTSTEPIHHISEIVQNEMDAGATEINVELIRKGDRKGQLQKIIISGNGFGFLESFEHYSKNIGSSIKKYFDEYTKRRQEGKSRGEFCIGLQGFRAICKELQIVNVTKHDIESKLDQQKEDTSFSKMYSNRKMILTAESLEAKIQEENEFSDHRETHGVTCTLLYPKVLWLKGQDIFRYLSQNKRSELLAEKNLNIIVKDGNFEKRVTPIYYSGDNYNFRVRHPKESSTDFRYRGLGELTANLWLHVEKPGSKIRLDVQKEPIILDITSFEEFNKPPWNSGCVEGIIEYPLLTKSPSRGGVERDLTFWPAFIEMMEVLEEELNQKVEAYQKKTKSKLDEKLMEKLDHVMGNVKRELDFATWYDKQVTKTIVGPLESIKMFPEVANVPLQTTKRVHVHAYDNQGRTLKEKDGIIYSWKVDNDLGTIIPKKDGEAIFKASSKIGGTAVHVDVTDTITSKELDGQIQIAITHLPHIGVLARVKIEPTVTSLSIGVEKEFTAIAEDEERNVIDKEIMFYWSIVMDETNGASLNLDYGESVVLCPGKNLGIIKLQVIATQGHIKKTDFALITVTEVRKKLGRRAKPKGAGLPTLDKYDDAHEIPLRHSYLSTNGTVLNCNEGHPDFKNAKSNGEKARRRYIATLYAKELAKKEHETTKKDYGELVLDVLSKIDRFW